MSKAIVGLVGPCGAGKSTLGNLLKQSGYAVKHIAQEHSYVPHMWQRIAKPDILIFLDVSYENSVKRRDLHWSPEEYQEQLRRLQHARTHADLIIDTNRHSVTEIFAIAQDFLGKITA